MVSIWQLVSLDSSVVVASCLVSVVEWNRWNEWWLYWCSWMPDWGTLVWYVLHWRLGLQLQIVLTW